jgi:phytoene desaturase
MHSGDELTTVVIGAGLSGLAAALALARQGRPVVVVEAQKAAGGCCSTSVSGDFTFNNGAVYVAVPSLLRASFARLGLDFDADVRLAPIARPHVAHLDSGTMVHLSTTDASRVEGRGQQDRTRLLREGLAKLQHDWSPIYRTLVRHVLPEEPSLVRTLGKLWRHLPRMGGHVSGLIASYFPDEDLQAAVASTLLYTGLAPERLPSTQIIGLLALLEEGFHLPYGGMGAIPAALERALQRHAVPIRFGAQVQEIVVERGQVRGIILTSGERIAAAQVVATCSGFAVLEHLLPPGTLPRSLAAKARRAPLSHRAVSVQVGYSGTAASDAFIVSRVPAMHRQGAMHALEPELPQWLAYTQPTQVLPGLAPANRHIIELHAPVSGIHSVSEWHPAMTAAVADQYLEALRQRVPGMSVESVRVLDPRDFARDRHLHEGALYGIAPGAPPTAFFPHRAGIRGLYLGGQTTFPGYGVPSAILSGIQAAEALLRDVPQRSARVLGGAALDTD